MDEKTLIENLPDLAQFKDAAYWLAHRGWSEANGGNMSMRVDFPKKLRYRLRNEVRIELPGRFPELGGVVLAITATGSRMRDLARELKYSVILVQIEKGGKEYRPLWGGRPPTSEFPAHLRVHRVLAKHHPDRRAVLHTHPAGLVSITHLPAEEREAVLHDVLFRMHPETAVFLPEGLEFIPFQVPGTDDLGDATADAFRKKKVVLWEKHGVVSAGEDLRRALDWIEILEKASDIYWRTGGRAEGLKPGDVEATKRTWVDGGG